MRGADALQLPVARRRVVVGVLDLFRAADPRATFSRNHDVTRR